MSRPTLEAVLDTIKEFDRIGRDAFFEKYGFVDRNITYEVQVGPHRYPSKALFGAAFARMPGEVARNKDECNGTEARKHLASLGLTITGVNDGTPPSSEPLKQADRIRSFVLENLIKPARARGASLIEIVSGDVHRQMELSNAIPAVCSALESQEFARLAKVKLLDRYSPIDSDKPSSTIRYQFALGDTVSVILNCSVLERLKADFLSQHADFQSFEDCPSFAEREGGYKRALVVEAERLVRTMENESDEEVGNALIELLAGRTELECNLIDWRAQKVIDDARAVNPTMVEAAVGRLAREGGAIDSVIAFVEKVWPAMRGNLPSNPYAESRMFPTMLRGLVDPHSVLPIRSTPTDNAARMLLGRRAFANGPLTRVELEEVTNMGREILRIMDEEWNWAPRDMWDVQGFIWETCQKRLFDPTDQLAETRTKNQEGKIAMPQPTNLILYGPPGTGKTYRTMEEAVRLSGDNPDADRLLLRGQYDRLRKEKRIEFVTFHQNFAYEEFVEGLRPQTGANGPEGNGVGFDLKPKLGIFRNICQLAEAATEAAAGGQPIDLSGKRIFKMSLGRAGIEDEIFEDAVENGYAVLGWGGDIDWSPYASYEAIHERWNQDHPGTNGNDANIIQTTRFRADMKEGDVIVVSHGNKLVRAIGIVSGPYRYEPSGTREYSHRRNVDWLKIFREPIDSSTIYDVPFIQWSCYLLKEQHLNRSALANLLPGVGGPAEPPKQYVLVIDEINRANISKVFGELITLIEPDKRIGMDEQLRVRLPYSEDEFGVPANLHIIGTMNTADRSIALLDTALRRRFKFKELGPDTSVPAFLEAAEATGLPLADVLNTINRRIEYLVDRDHRIGHAFFIGCQTKDAVDAVMRDKVIPLLQEYFFDDWNRLVAVLGEKEKGGNFLEFDIIGDPMGEGGEPLKSWRIRSSFDTGAYERLAGRAALPDLGTIENE